MPIEETLNAMGIALPEVAAPVASYVPAVRVGNLVYTSGQLPTEQGKLRHQGKVGSDLDEDEAYGDACVAALNALAAIKSVTGSLDSVRRIVRVMGYVNSEEGFTGQPVVINGASDFLVQLFGDRGRHARSAVGVYELPLNAAVEIEIIAEVE